MAAWFASAKKLQGVQTAFLRDVCGSLPVGTPGVANSSELAEDTCSLNWWVQLVKFAMRISDRLQGSLHREILRGNVQDALAGPSSAISASLIIGLASTFCS